jgi:hypothetical protein
LPPLIFKHENREDLRQKRKSKENNLETSISTNTSTSLTAQIHMYFGDVTFLCTDATTHIGQILLGVSHTQHDSAHTSTLLTAQHITHRRFTLVSAFELKHKHQTDLCATSIVDDETKTMHA